VSPQIHAAAFAATGLDLAYLAFAVPRARLTDAVRGLGALGALGANVTVPHKQAVLVLADTVGEDARLAGAANTLTWEGGALAADNTDAPGLARVLADVGLRPGDPVVLFGAGGAALAAAVALGRVGARVEVVARRAEAAAAVGERVVHAGGGLGPAPDPRLVLNATPLGLHGEQVPDRFLHLGPGQVALDLVYGPEPTPFLRAAAAAGARAVDGRALLVAQAALSFERWTGVRPPLSAMSRAADAALARKT